MSNPTEVSTPKRDATRHALLAFWQDFMDPLSEEKAQELLKNRDAVLADLQRHATPPPPDFITIEVTKDDVLTPPKGYRFVADECFKQPLGPFAIERGVFHEQDEKVVPGEDMLDCEQAINLRIGTNGTAALNRQLDKIPPSWEGTYLVATGCVIEDERRPGTSRRVAYFCRDGRRVVMGWHGLVGGYDRAYQALRIRPPAAAAE